MVERAQAADGFRAFENQAGEKFQVKSSQVKHANESRTTTEIDSSESGLK